MSSHATLNLINRRYIAYRPCLELRGQDQVLVKKQLRRDQMATFFVNEPPCLPGMEVCGSDHHWARTLQAMGHTVRLMAPQFVKPYCWNDAIGNKGDIDMVSVGLVYRFGGRRPNRFSVPRRQSPWLWSRHRRRLPSSFRPPTGASCPCGDPAQAREPFCRIVVRL